jgi:geranylgeranyl pyrophosphate synthase
MRSSARIGALCARLPDDAVAALSDFGQAFGMAFQIIDDVLDVVATDAQLGKPAGHDIVEGIYNLPVLYALEEVGPDLAVLLGGPIAGADLDEARRLVRGSSGVTRAIDLARSFIDDATQSAASLGDTPSAAALAGSAEHLLLDVEAVLTA